MRILIVTQRVDKDDAVLGFFHRWIEEFAKQCEKVTVIAQFVGSHSLPDNVNVLSLGKETGYPRVLQVFRYRWLLFRERKHYDTILIHMTPIWAVIGWRAVFLLRKPMYMWYEARGTRWPLRVALFIVKKVFSASSYGMPLSTKKSRIMGHGIDTNVFRPTAAERDPRMLVTVGRITPSKHLDQVIDAFTHFSDGHSLHLVGEARTEDDRVFQVSLQKSLQSHGLSHRVHIHSATQIELPVILQAAHLFLHASTSGLDKAVLEAMACGCLVVSSSPAFRELLPPACSSTVEDFPKKSLALQTLSIEEDRRLREELREIIEKQHSLPQLISRLLNEMGA